MPAVLENGIPRLPRPCIPAKFIVHEFGDATIVLAHACPLEEIKNTRWGKEVQEEFGWENFTLSGVVSPSKVFAMRITTQAGYERAMLDMHEGMVCQMHPAGRKIRQAKHKRKGNERLKRQARVKVKNIIVTDMCLREDSTCAWVTVRELEDGDWRLN